MFVNFREKTFFSLSIAEDEAGGKEINPAG